MITRLIIIGLLLMIGGMVTVMYFGLNKEFKKNIETWKERTITKEEE